MKKKRYLFKILFSVCFCIYAALPFLYTGKYGKAFDRTVLEKKDGCRTPLNAADFNAFMEHLRARPACRKAHDKNLHAFHVLFKKSRATLDPEDVEDAGQLEGNTGTVSRSRVPSGQVHGIPVQNDEFKLRESFYQSHSGLSPPSA